MELEVGDIIFIAIKSPLYRQVAWATNSWTSHVGIVIEDRPGAVMVAEGAVPLSKVTPLPKFISRSIGGRYSVKRLKRPLSIKDKEAIKTAARKRMGIFYHTGFNYDSQRQFCSKVVYDVLKEAVGAEVGKLETFEELFGRQPNVPVWFWRMWYFGFIPWHRRTVSPASQYESPLLRPVEESQSVNEID